MDIQITYCTHIPHWLHILSICLYLSLAGQNLASSRGERVWSNSHQVFVLHISSSASNEVGVNINWNMFRKGSLNNKANCTRTSIITNLVNMPRNSWYVRNEMMMRIWPDSLLEWESGLRDYLYLHTTHIPHTINAYPHTECFPPFVDQCV